MSKPAVIVTRLTCRDFPELFVRFEETEGLSWILISNQKGADKDATRAQGRAHVLLLEGSGWTKTVRRY